MVNNSNTYSYRYKLLIIILCKIIWNFIKTVEYDWIFTLFQIYMSIEYINDFTKIDVI